MDKGVVGTFVPGWTSPDLAQVCLYFQQASERGRNIIKKLDTVMAKKSAGLPFHYILVKSGSNNFIQVVDINQKTNKCSDNANLEIPINYG